MPSNRTVDRSERLYVQVQTSLQEIPNSSGTATVANGDAFKHATVALNNQRDRIDSRNKTGSRTLSQGIGGPRRGAFSVDLDLDPSGSLGTAPDADALLEALFGQAADIGTGSATITGAADNGSGLIRITATAHGLSSNDAVYVQNVGGVPNANGGWVVTVNDANTFDLIGSVFAGAYTSGGTAEKATVKYAMSDDFVNVVLWRFFSQPATAEQDVAVGCAVGSATFTFGNPTFEVQFEGQSSWVLDSKRFAGIPGGDIERGGLTSYPSEPGAPVTNGGIIAGQNSRLAIDGVFIDSPQSATVTVQTGHRLREGEWETTFPDASEGTTRRVEVNITLSDSDLAALTAAKASALTLSPVDVVLRVGQDIGSTFLVLLKNVQFEPAQRAAGEFSTSLTLTGVAHGSSLTATDEITLWQA